MKKIVLFLCLFSALMLFGCQRRPHKIHSCKVKSKKEVAGKNDSGDFFLYWMMLNNSYYSYESETPITNFSSVTWTESKTDPTASFTEEEISEQSEMEVTPDEMSPEMQTDMETSSDAEGGDAGGDGGGDGGGGGD